MPHQPPPSRRPDEVGGHAQRHRVPGGLWERRSLPGDAVELWIVSCCVIFMELMRQWLRNCKNRNSQRVCGFGPLSPVSRALRRSYSTELLVYTGQLSVLHEGTRQDKHKKRVWKCEGKGMSRTATRNGLETFSKCEKFMDSSFSLRKNQLVLLCVLDFISNKRTALPFPQVN